MCQITISISQITISMRQITIQMSQKREFNFEPLYYNPLIFVPNHCICMSIVIPISYPPNISWNWLRGIYMNDEKLHHGLMFLPLSCRNLCTHMYRKHPLGFSTYHQKMNNFYNLMHSGLMLQKKSKPTAKQLHKWCLLF